jgi:hypothetical protein
VDNLHFGIPFCGKSPQLGLFDYSQKKIQPIPSSRRCWDQPFSIGKVSSKSKTRNLKCQIEVILGDFNHHNSDIYVLKFYVWFKWVAPKNFNPMDNHHKFQKEQRLVYGCWVHNASHGTQGRAMVFESSLDWSKEWEMLARVKSNPHL